MVYLPPKPSYTFKKENETVLLEADDVRQPLKSSSSELRFWLLNEGGPPHLVSKNIAEVCFVKTKKGSQIPVCWIRITQRLVARPPRGVLVFSHGNATDIGYMLEMLAHTASKLHVDIVCYDYTGYGASGGLPSPSHTLADGEAVLAHVKAQLAKTGRASTPVILYGQSLGSGPTLHLARREQVAGVVVHSGLMSALRVIRPDIEEYPTHHHPHSIH